MRDYLRTFSLCFEFWKNYRATEPFPGIGFQTTNERRSPDDLPRSEVKQSVPISGHYRFHRAKHKRFFAVLYNPGRTDNPAPSGREAASLKRNVTLPARRR